MMDGVAGALFLSLFLSGLASSLHCVGMCGPLLLAFHSLTRGKEQGAGSLRALWLPYHAGRIWTYALVGFAVGIGSFELRSMAGSLGWQRPAAVAAAVVILLLAAASLGWIPRVPADWGLSACLLGFARKKPWLQGLLGDPRPGARLLLGALMGLLPCAMVYGALVVSATLPTPFHSALGMALFGLGTLPSLTAVVLGNRFLSPKLRLQGPKLAALVWLGVGVFILLRAFLGASGGHGHH